MGSEHDEFDASEFLSICDLDITAFSESLSPSRSEQLSYSRSHEEYRRPGRKVTEESVLLNKFHPLRKNSFKKEYIRTKLIRGHKRLIRDIYKGKLSAMNDTTSEASAVLGKLQRIHEESPAYFKELSATKNGPGTDGKAHRAKYVEAAEQTFNKAYCSRYFSDERVTQSFYYYIELRFCEKSPAALCEFFRVRCCSSNLHSEECVELWEQVKSYFNFTMIWDLGGMPFSTEELFLSDLL